MPRFSIVGMKYRPPALKFIEELASGTKLLLVREPSNPADPNAVGVWFQLGYIPAADAARLAPKLDAQTNLLGTTRGEFCYDPHWPKVEIKED